MVRLNLAKNKFYQRAQRFKAGIRMANRNSKQRGLNALFNRSPGAQAIHYIRNRGRIPPQISRPINLSQQSSYGYQQVHQIRRQNAARRIQAAARRKFSQIRKLGKNIRF